MDELNKDELLRDLGRKVRRRREQMGINQTQFASSIGKEQPSINRLETGRINPSFIYLLEVCKGLGVTLEELLNS